MKHKHAVPERELLQKLELLQTYWAEEKIKILATPLQLAVDGARLLLKSYQGAPNPSYQVQIKTEEHRKRAREDIVTICEQVCMLLEQKPVSEKIHKTAEECLKIAKNGLQNPSFSRN